MSFRHFILFIAAGAFLIVSCKKEKEEPIDPGTGCTNCTNSTASVYSGILRAGTYTTVASGGGSTVVVRASAYFSQTPVSIAQPVSALTVSAVYFNEDTLQNSGHPYYYTKTPVSLTAESWTIVGSGDIPSFQYKNLKEKPTFTAIKGIPDTIKKNIGFTLIVDELSNATGATFMICDGHPTSPKIVTKALGIGNDTVNFKPSQLLSLATSTSAYVSLIIENAHAIKVQGKDFKCSKDVHWTKMLVIK